MKTLIYLFLLFTLFQGQAQEYALFEIVDSKTNKAVSFASIRFMNTSKGVISDFNGQFRITNSILDTITFIEISSLGYKTTNYKTSNLENNIINRIELEPQVEMLGTVVLKPKTRDAIGTRALKSLATSKNLYAREIVEKAVNNIKFNLNNSPHSFVGYYRDYQINDIGEYINLNEAIIEQFDGGIETNKLLHKTNQAALYFFKQNKKFLIDTVLSKKYDAKEIVSTDREKYVPNANIFNFGGNEFQILNTHDPIRLFNKNSFSFVYRMNKEFLNNHIFEKGKIYYNDGDPIIFINFRTVENNEQADPYTPDVISVVDSSDDLSRFGKFSAKGSLKVSLLDFSIYAFEYNIFKKGNSDPLAHVEVEYKKIDDKMYLNYITFNNRFEIKEYDVFKDEAIVYDKASMSLDITFNRNLDKSTVQKRNFKVFFKDKKVSLNEIEIINDNTVKLFLTNSELENMIDADDFDITIKRVKDLNNNKIYKPISKVANQFREYFVQEVFTSKQLDRTIDYIYKYKPLKKSTINSDVETRGYIINSPLMKRKM